MNTMASANLGLSLLSRGVGEEKYSGKSRKLEVLLEPEDYFNIRKKGLYLPPIHQHSWAAEDNLSGKPIQAHKTYTTRKGALLLYAEDLALSYPTQHSHRKSRKKSLEAEDTSYLSTMKDLRSAILSYGAKEENVDVFMGFTNSKMNNFNSPRTVRPGFSAKRYLSNWSKSWDDSILNYLRSEGHLWDKNLFESNSVLPSTYRRINDDMSGVPPPYRVTRNMLVSPGDIMSYEFYRIRPDDIEYGSGDTPRGVHPPRPPKGSPASKISQSGMIAAIARDGDQKPHPVIYSQLTPDEQQIILQNLILQSAAHHSQEKAEDDGAPLGSQVIPLDMGEAIVHLVNENSKNILSGGSAFKLPEATIEEQYTESTPSESSWPDVTEALPYTEVAPHFSKSGSVSSIPVLPPISVSNQQFDKTDETTHIKTSDIGENIKLPDINIGASLLGGGGGRGSQKSKESFKKSVKSDPDGRTLVRHEDKMNPDGSRSNQDSVSRKLQKTGSKHSLISNEDGGSVPSISSQLSQSFENLDQADEHLVKMKGGVVPKNLTEGMRSYKGSKTRSSTEREGGDGEDVLSVGDDNFSIVGSIISAPNNQNSDEEAEEDIEHLKQALGGDGQKDEENINKETPSSSRQDGRVSQQDPVIKIPSEMPQFDGSSELPPPKDEEMPTQAEKMEGQEADSNDREKVDSEAKPITEQTQSDDDDDDNDSEIDDEYDGDDDNEDDDYDDGDDDDVKDESFPMDIPASSHLSNKESVGMKDKDGDYLDDKKPLTSEMVKRDSDAISEDGITGAMTSDGAGLGTKEVEDTILSTAPTSKQLNVAKDDQQIPTAVIGDDLTLEAAVSEKSFPKSKKKSAASVLETSQSPPQAESCFNATEFFTTFSYVRKDSSGATSWLSGERSILSSLLSDRDDTEVERIIDDTSGDDEDWEEAVEEADGGEALTREKIPETGDDDTPLEETGPSNLNTEEQDGSIHLEDGDRGTESLEEEHEGSAAPSMGAISNNEAALMENYQKDESMVSGTSDDKVARSRHNSSRSSSFLEQLEEQAAAIAEAVIQRPKSGRDLAEDAQLAATLWRERLGQLLQARPPPDDTQSMIYRRRRNSLDGSSVASSDVGLWDGADLLTGLERKSRRQRRVSSARATVDLLDPSLNSEDSTPSMEPASGDNLQLDVTNFGVADKTEQRRASESKEDDELNKIVSESGLLSKTHPGTGSSKKSKGSKSSKSRKSDKSSKKSGKSQKADKNVQETEKTKEFIVSMPRDDKEDYLAYKPIEEPVTKIQDTGNATKQVAPKPPKKPKKEKVKKEKVKKTKKQANEKKTTEVTQEEKEAAEAPSAEQEPEVKVDESEEVKKESVDEGAEEAEMEEGDEEKEDSVREEVESPEFIIIHEEFSDSEPEEEVKPAEVQQPSTSDSLDDGQEMSEIGTEYTEDSSNQRPGSLTRSQARAAKRAAETERKKREIERKRKEKEAAKRKAQEEQERKEKIMMEFEEERRKKEEQMRMKQEAEENAKRQAELAKQERERQAALAAERERKQQEEYKKKLEALAKKKKEEDKLRQEMEEKKRKEEEEQRKQEEEMLAKMAEEERLEYEKRKQEEELIAQIKAEEERLRREVEAKLAQEEAERIALEMAKRQKELEIRLQFNRELNSEANVFAHSQEMTRAFTWSYFELLEYLGIPIPENMRERYLKGQLIPQTHKDHGESSE